MINLHCLLVCFCLLSTIATNRAQDECHEDIQYRIATQGDNNLVVDITDLANVKLQPLDTANQFQIFQFRCSTKVGTYKIVNPATGLVLTSQYATPNFIIASKDDGSLFQDWMVSTKGNIVNVAIYALLYPEDGQIAADVNLQLKLLDSSGVVLPEKFVLVPV